MTLVLSSLTLKPLQEVIHLGTLQRQDRGRLHAQSHEGHCLSVSLHPAAWRAIARLGGQQAWRLSRPDGVFVDVHQTLASSAARDALCDWGVRHELAAREIRWLAYEHDTETDEWRFSVHREEQDACLEVEDPSALAEDGLTCVRSCELLVGTSALSERVGVALHERDATEFVLMVWAEQCLDVDGLWWDDVLDVASLSAPRGGIFPQRIALWSKERISEPGSQPETLVSPPRR